MPKKITATTIKRSLLRQLKDNGADVTHFLGLVDDFIFMWEKSEEMKENIEKRGLTYESISSTGQKYERENPCVKNLLQYNKQMLSILKDLHLSTDNIRAEEDDEL
ncbi:MAG: P27 family phage terminase small subunit [Candidatus Alectryocaccobium sp.]|jgi:hypothetical protein